MSILFIIYYVANEYNDINSLDNLVIIMKFSKSKNPIIIGSLLLTSAGIIAKLIGFFYRIYISNIIGAQGMGLYQLTFSCLGIVYAICMVGIQTAISKYTAQSPKNMHYLYAGLTLSVVPGCVIAVILYLNSDYISSYLLLNSQCSELVRMLALSVPFTCIHCCINGYYYGRKEIAFPAITEIIEQLVKLIFIILITSYMNQHNINITAIIAIYAIIISEGVSALISCICINIKKIKLKKELINSSIKKCIKDIFVLSFPLSLSRILMHLLSSGESILIPAQLQLAGLNSHEAMSIFGIMSAMALTLILFPTTITNAVCVLLLPSVSHAKASNDHNAISRYISLSIKLSIICGIYFTAIFILYGSKLGALVFNEPLVAPMVSALSWLCPFMYIASTLGSILNGMSKTKETCIQNCIGLVIRILFVIFAVPQFGISGYMSGLLISQILVCFMHIYSCHRLYPLSFNPYQAIIKPLLLMIIAAGTSLLLYKIIAVNVFSILPSLLISSLTATVIYFILIIPIIKKS